MSFLQVRQSTQTGERQTFSSASAIAYIQELKHDQDLGWQIGVDPYRALMYLHHKLEPIISLDSSDDLVRRANPNTRGVRVPQQKLAKKLSNCSFP
ncbi:hypothetical protein ACTRXD_09135 [Nitrospira sp. T9]|uniref:hypothetical protein n=1 Tax=unclassified Nitrospira TaxID=2652172 RepID=UPI003F97F3FC